MNTKTSFDEVERIARDWAAFMQIETPFEIQYGPFDGLPEELKATGDEFGVTIGYPEGNFIVCISDKCPPEKLEEVIVHELVHVHTFAQSGPDERDAMEVATELAAGLVIQLRASEQSEGTPTDAQIVAEAERRYEPYRGASVPQTLLREPFIEGAKWMREHALKQADAGAIQRLRGLRESQVPGPFLTVPREVVDAICDGGRQPEDDHAMVVACDAKQYTSDAETKAFRDGWKSRVPTIQAKGPVCQYEHGCGDICGKPFESDWHRKGFNGGHKFDAGWYFR